MKYYVLVNYDPETGIKNQAGMFETLEEANAKKEERENQEKEWVIWKRHEYKILELNFADVKH